MTFTSTVLSGEINKYFSVKVFSLLLISFFQVLYRPLSVSLLGEVGGTLNGLLLKLAFGGGGCEWAAISFHTKALTHS